MQRYPERYDGVIDAAKKIRKYKGLTYFSKVSAVPFSVRSLDMS
jgi:hypothetical protein